MEFQKTHLEEFTIVGISVRTINNGQAGVDIKNLWDRFYAEGIADKISNKLSTDLYCVYTDYASDYTDYYTCILGYKVATAEDLPVGLTYCVIPAADYKVYESTGELPQAVLATWQQIWDSGIKRAYKADFDIYTDASWKGGGVKTYVGI